MPENMEAHDERKIRERISVSAINCCLRPDGRAARAGSDRWDRFDPGSHHRLDRRGDSRRNRDGNQRRTGVKTERQTTGAGLYVLAPLPPGEYKITVSATGFRQLEQDRVIVDALSTVGLNLTLQVGTASETVTITSAPAQLNTSDPRLGTTIRNELYTNLPLAMGTAVAGSGIGQGPRNPGAFIFLLPGVSEGNRWGTINGAQGFSKDVFIEGVPITDPIQQG